MADDEALHRVELLLRGALDCSVAAYSCYTRSGPIELDKLIDLHVFNLRMMDLASDCIREVRLAARQTPNTGDSDAEPERIH